MANVVLLVEDDPDTVEIVQLYLSHEGYRLLVASDGLTALRLAKEAKPDLIILDLMLPKLDGMAVCQQIREESWIPIIMLTARVEEASRLAGLDLGADDYISKPFSPKELVARVKAVLRRTDPEVFDRGGPQQLDYRGITVDLKEYQVKVNGESVPLTPTEMRLLVMFMREPGRVFTREQIVDRVFERGFDNFDRTVDTHISNLRRKLEPGKKEPQYIQTIYGLGYKLSHE
jgi:two-component system alkaline phosphatase synthesis response regulator PhoP